MARQSFLTRALIVLGVAGLGVSIVMLYVHHQLTVTGGTYTSFCNVSKGVNCDAVLSSQYAEFLRIPVALWAAATYCAVMALASWSWPPARIALLALAGGGAGYSLFLAVVSVVVLQTVCLLCTTLYVVNAGILVLAIAHAFRTAGRGATAAAALAPMALAALVGYAANSNLLVRMPETLDEVRQREPEFYDWYTALPFVAGASDVESGPTHVRGRAGAAVTIVEFSDFACQHCAAAHEALKRVMARHPDDVRMIFRHFPLDTECNPAVPRQVHPTACMAAMAAECAGQQGRFWEYHDYLFEHAQPWDWLAAAGQVGIDVEQFRQCLLHEAPRDTVERDVRRGVELGVKSTPTTYMNGRTIAGTLEDPYYEHAFVIERDKTEQAAAQ